MLKAFRLLPLAACLALAQAGAATEPADATELRLCIEENPYPPLIFRDRDGAIPILVKMAAAQAGVKVSFHRAPFLRCMAEIRSGNADGYPSTAWRPDWEDAFVYPGLPGTPDTSRATVRTRQLVYRRIGSSVEWDGQNFNGLQRPVLHDRSGLLVAERLRNMGIAADNNAKNTEANFGKLVAERGDAVVGFEVAGTPLLRSPAFKGKVEPLPQPFFEENYYLGAGHAAYAKHRARFEALWQAISRVKASPAYQAAIRDLPSE